jgi:hypothetical protein
MKFQLKNKDVFLLAQQSLFLGGGGGGCANRKKSLLFFSCNFLKEKTLSSIWINMVWVNVMLNALGTIMFNEVGRSVEEVL